jgi:hypothetical protein
MITTILIWLYIFIISTAFGHLLFGICNRLLKTETYSYPTLFELSFFGLTVIGIILSYLSIFFKIGLLSNVFILLIISAYFFSDPRTIILYYADQFQNFNKHPLTIRLLSGLYFIMILFAAQSFPKIYDTGLYHAQFIQWISSFKTIPGLGNLHGRFAYNNQSFLLESFFNFSFLKIGSFHLVNSYLLLLLSFSLIRSLYKSILSDLLKSVLYFGLLILFQIFHLVFASSPTPDLFSTVGIWFVFILFLKKLSTDVNHMTYWIILILCTFFLITVKLSSLPLILITLLFLINPTGNIIKKIMILSGLGLIVFIPFFIRNYLISGYLIYPYPAIDLFNPDWKIPHSYVAEMKSIITSYAQCRDWQERPFSEWLPIWFSERSAIFKVLSVFIMVSPFLMITVLLIRKKILNLFKSELQVFFICLLAIVFWFVTAPNFRFIYGFLFVYLLIFGIIILHFLFIELRVFGSPGTRIKIFLKMSYPKITSVALIILPVIFLINCDFGEIEKSIVFPVKYKSVPLKTVEINNLKVNIPEDNAQCWDACIPCSIFQSNMGITDIEMRGKDFNDGFRVKNKTEKR